MSCHGEPGVNLVRLAMRMSANRVIFGEMLGDEIGPMLNAMNSGAASRMCTLHRGGHTRRDWADHLSASRGASTPIYMARSRTGSKRLKMSGRLPPHKKSKNWPSEERSAKDQALQNSL
jgi:hypothetical protein